MEASQVERLEMGCCYLSSSAVVKGELFLWILALEQRQVRWASMQLEQSELQLVPWELSVVFAAGSVTAFAAASLSTAAACLELVAASSWAVDTVVVQSLECWAVGVEARIVCIPRWDSSHLLASWWVCQCVWVMQAGSEEASLGFRSSLTYNLSTCRRCWILWDPFFRLRQCQRAP